MTRILGFLMGILLLIKKRISAGSHGIFLRTRRRYIGVSFMREQFWPFRILPVICGGTDAISTTGAYIEKGDGASPEQFTELGEVVTIGGPNPDSEELDATHLRSPARTREYIQSFLVPGEIPLTVNWIGGDSSHQGMLSDYAAGTTRNFVIHYPDGGTDAFAAYVKNRPTSLNVGEVLRISFTLRVTGAIVYTPPTP
jgi:hypothetical protein